MRPRSIVVFACTACGHETAKWSGRCPGCAAWNTLIEELRNDGAETVRARYAAVEAQPLAAASARILHRFTSGIAEFDRVLGGGVVPSSVILVGGDPGIGKSTLLLQALHGLGATRAPVLYASAEESEEQVRMRAHRLGLASGAGGFFLTAEANVDAVIGECERIKAMAVVADSVQTLWSDRLPSAPGSVGQVREVAARFVALAKSTGAVVFLVGHVTKDGAIAGPRTLEHMVDTVLYFEGDRGRAQRVVRAIKNRFGPAGEIGVFEMGEGGLAAVANPSAHLLAERAAEVPGSAVLASLEGTRALLIEVQALVAEGVGLARRTATGFDPNRLALLLAVLDRRAGIDLRGRDLFVNVVGGLDLGEPAADLGVAVAAASAAAEAPVDPDTLVFGEVGLAGELRGVGRADLRLAEARRMGFARAVVPASNAAQPHPEGLEVVGAGSLREALEHVLRYPSGGRTRSARRE